MTTDIPDNIDPEEKPKKKSSKKKEDKKESLPEKTPPVEDNLKEFSTFYVTADSLDEVKDPELRDFLAEIINEAIDKPLNIKPKKILNEDIVKSRLGEFLDAYILVGYDAQGQRLAVKSADNDMTEDALIEQLRCLFIKMMGPSQ